MAKAANKQALPFGLRLKAWWEGYDTSDLQKRWAARNGTAAEEVRSRPEPQPVEETTEPEAEVPLDRKHMPWDDRRVEIAELVWGEGYCGPGGPENVIAMSKLLSLSPEMSMLVLGAELGGPARTLAQHFGVWISGYEADQQLVDAGMKISERKGMAKKAPILHYDFEDPAPFERRFDRIFTKEYLSHIKNIDLLFTRVEDSLKDDGLMLITSYVLADEQAAFDPTLREWLQKEPVPHHLKTPQEIVKSLDKAGFAVRVNEDITEHYQHLVQSTWRKADMYVSSLMKKGEEGKTLVEILLKEAELWAERGRLFDTEKLRVWRLVAHKKDVGKLMSDW